MRLGEAGSARAVRRTRRSRDRLDGRRFSSVFRRRRIIYVMLTNTSSSRRPVPDRKCRVRHLEFDRSLPRVMLLFHASTRHRHQKRHTCPRLGTQGIETESAARESVRPPLPDPRRLRAASRRRRRSSSRVRRRAGPARRIEPHRHLEGRRLQKPNTHLDSRLAACSRNARVPFEADEQPLAA